MSAKTRGTPVVAMDEPRSGDAVRAGMSPAVRTIEP
jgi:hypothetical protein